MYQYEDVCVYIGARVANTHTVVLSIYKIFTRWFRRERTRKEEYVCDEFGCGMWKAIHSEKLSRR